MEQAKVEDPRPGEPATGDGWLEPDPPAAAVERPGRTGGLMGRPGPAASQAKVSPTRVEIGIGPFPSRGGLGKGHITSARKILT